MREEGEMDTLDLFRDRTDVRQLDAGEVIFQQGDAADVMYVVLSGEVEIVFGEDVIDRLQDGDIFGEMALVDRLPRSATARVSRRCRLVPVDRPDFLATVERAPRFALEVLEVLAERLRRHMVVSQALLLTKNELNPRY